jgi:hypothetical protein
MNNNTGWQKRHAIQIVSQLPENVEDALAVLDYARDLVTDFLAAEAEDVADRVEGRASANVSAFPASCSSR